MRVRFPQHYRRLDLGRRVAIRCLISFLTTFLILRAITIIHFELLPHGPFRNLVTKGGLRIHQRLADVYWSPEGVESLKAGAVEAALLALHLQ